MAIELRHIIHDTANRADEFLGDAPDRKHARAGIEEYLTLEHAGLAREARRQVVAGVMAALEAEDFFGIEFVGDAFRDDDRESGD